MSARIVGLVLRAQDKSVCANFYDRLGLELHEHQHGGPMHFEMRPHAPEVVFELYQASSRYQQDALIIEVDSLADALRVCAEFGIMPASALKESPDAAFVYIADPDGRCVMLVEQKTVT